MLFFLFFPLFVHSYFYFLFLLFFGFFFFGCLCVCVCLCEAALRVLYAPSSERVLRVTLCVCVRGVDGVKKKMRPLGLSSRHERELANESPVLISVGRADFQLRSEMDQTTAALRQRETQRQQAFRRERAAARSRVDRDMQVLLEGVEGVLPPCVIDPPVITETRSSLFSLPGKKGAARTAHATEGLPPPSFSTSSGERRVLVLCGDSRNKLNDAAKEVKSSQVAGPPRSGGGTLPRGFPLPFEESGFQCVAHWADTSFQEVLLAALGPRSQRERREKDAPSSRFLVSVACYLLNELLTREPKMSVIWPELREVIFKAVFQPCTSSSVPGTEGNDASFYPRFESCHDFTGLHLWSDALFASRTENARLQQRIEELKGILQKSRLVLRFAQRRVDRMRLWNTFRAWRKTTRRERLFFDSATAYFTRVRQRLRIEGCFLRWRRIAAQSHGLELLRMLKESEVRLAFVENSNTKKVATLMNELEKERKSNLILEMKKEALKSQLAEGHVIALRAIDNEIQQHQANVLMAKKQSKRWERLAKTFSYRFNCVMVPPSLRRYGVALRLIEDKYALNAPVPNNLGMEARRGLEAFLLDWVNCFMRATVGSDFWRPVVKINTGLDDGDFGPGALLQFVRALESVYIAKGAQCTASTPPVNRWNEIRRSTEEKDSSNSPTEVQNDVVFTELRRLLYMQTMEGLYPTLLCHCTFLESFFTPVLFCRTAHPTAMLWVLASLFVGYTRLVCSGSALVENDLDAALRCQGEGALQNHTTGPPSMCNEKAEPAPAVAAAAAKEAPFTKRRSKRGSSRAHIVSKNTTIIKRLRPKPWHAESLRKRHEEEEAEEKAASEMERLADTLSDLEVYLGLEEQEDEESSSSSKSNSRCTSSDGVRTFHRNDDDVELASTVMHYSSDTREESFSKTGTNVTREERKRRVNRKARLIPPMNTSIASFSLRDFVAYQGQEAKKRRLWKGFSRVVTSLVVRLRVLDVEPPVSVEINFVSGRKKSSPRMKNTSLSTSSRAGFIPQSRKSIRLVPSFS
ncbi:hypothetical protein MOQ_007132 [Trypanosoma cruzi marinkellei]|uniref:Uncharacterized protein n=1 Tax=Trypanosoma cruzi marinkellei TaxID=85056 RepID=K2MPX0_TRYCR|nr:hypothetical protein MOQ_007132 [Trypanosoma cruzi marinkellei]